MINWFLLKHFVCAIFVLVKFLTLPASPCVMDACKMLFFLLLVTCPNVYSLSRFCLASWLGITVLNTKSISLGSFNQDSIPWKLYGTSFNKADSAVYYLADRMRLLLFLDKFNHCENFDSCSFSKHDFTVYLLWYERDYLRKVLSACPGQEVFLITFPQTMLSRETSTLFSPPCPFSLAPSFRTQFCPEQQPNKTRKSPRLLVPVKKKHPKLNFIHPYVSDDALHICNHENYSSKQNKEVIRITSM